MDNETFYGQTSRALAAKVRAAVAMTSTDAARLPATGLDGDTSVTIRCGGKEERWNSRYLAFHYYYAGAMACEGSSEGDRYWQVCGGLLMGEEIPHDDIPIRKSA